MGKKKIPGNICHIKILLYVFFDLCFFLVSTAQNDKVLLYQNSEKIHRLLMKNYHIDDTNKCFLIDFNKRTQQFKICKINKSDFGVFCNAEYNIDSLYGISLEGECLCFLFGDKCFMFHKSKCLMPLPDFFYEQLKYREHRYLNINDYKTIPPIFQRFFVDCFKKKNNKLIFLFKKEISINDDYYNWSNE